MKANDIHDIKHLMTPIVFIMLNAQSNMGTEKMRVSG